MTGRRKSREDIEIGNPYIRKGRCVYKRDTGEKVGCSSSIEKAKAYFAKLEMLAHQERKG